MGVYQDSFGLKDYPEKLIEEVIRYRMHPYGITEPYLSFAEIAVRVQLTPEAVEQILRATAIVWGH
ncbi:MAG: hypothetical protein J5722_11500 [Oscillospiraceae bacterium]|nr:hypothetical protein [Oscillospiraceae bacterium]